jgi:hypothetical protein
VGGLRRAEPRVIWLTFYRNGPAQTVGPRTFQRHFSIVPDPAATVGHGTTVVQAFAMHCC